MNRKPNIDAVIWAARPGARLLSLLTSLREQSTPPAHILVITADEALVDERIRGIEGVEVYHAAPGQQLPGSVHNMAAGLTSADILFFFSQDVIPADKRLISKMLRPFHDRMVKAVYARQIPDRRSGIVEGCSLLMEYPDESCARTSADIPSLGAAAFRCSNACAAYEMELFRQIGGFPAPVLCEEASLYAAKIIRKGYKVAYAANTAVRVNVHMSSSRAFREAFDKGMAFALRPELTGGVKAAAVRDDEERVAAYMSEQQMNAYLPSFKERCRLERVGWKLGRRCRSLPDRVVRKITLRPDILEAISRRQ